MTSTFLGTSYVKILKLNSIKIIFSLLPCIGGIRNFFPRLLTTYGLITYLVLAHSSPFYYFQIAKQIISESLRCLYHSVHSFWLQTNESFVLFKGWSCNGRFTDGRKKSRAERISMYGDYTAFDYRLKSRSKNWNPSFIPQIFKNMCQILLKQNLQLVFYLLVVIILHWDPYTFWWHRKYI